MCAEGQMLVSRVAEDAIRSAGLDVSHVGGLTMGGRP